MVLQNVDSSRLSPTLDPSPSISVLSFEGHRLRDTLKSFPVVGTSKVGLRSLESTTSGNIGSVKSSDHGDRKRVSDVGNVEEIASEPEVAQPTATSPATAYPATPSTPTAMPIANPDIEQSNSGMYPTSQETTLRPSPTASIKTTTTRPSPTASIKTTTASTVTTSNTVHHIISIASHVWLCDSSGFVHVYCAMTYQPLLSFPVSSNSANSASSATSYPASSASSTTAASSSLSTSAFKGASKDTLASTSAYSKGVDSVNPSYATKLLFVSAANQVFAALNDGNVVFCNVAAVASHLPPLEMLEEGAKAEHKWLNQTLMQVYFVGFLR